MFEFHRMSQEEVLEAFEDYGLENGQKNEIAHLVDLCQRAGMDAEALGDKYMQWKLNNKRVEDVITIEYLKRFEREAKILNFKRPPKPMVNLENFHRNNSDPAFVRYQ